MVVGHGPQGPTAPRLLKKDDKGDNQEGGYRGKDQIERTDKNTANVVHVIRNAQIESLGLGPVNGLPDALHEKHQAEGGHEEHERGAVYEGLEDTEHNHVRPDGHHSHCQQQSKPQG